LESLMVRFVYLMLAGICVYGASVCSRIRSDDAKPRIREIILSPMNMAQRPRLLTISPEEFYATWFEFADIQLGKVKRSMVVSPYDAKQKKFGPAFRGFKTDWAKGVGLTDTAAELALLPRKSKKEEMPILFAAFERHDFLVFDNAPPFLFAILTPDVEKREYRTTELKRVFGPEARVGPNRIPGAVGMDLVLWSPKGNKERLLLFGSLDRLWSCVSPDLGKTWEKPQVILDTRQGGHHVKACISSGPKLTLFFSRNDDLKMMHSRDGVTWSKPTTIKMSYETSSGFPFVEPDGTIWLAFSGMINKTKNFAIFLTQSKDQGETWAKPIQLTKGDQVDDNPSLAVGKNELILLFNRFGRGKRTLSTVAALVVDRNSLPVEFEPKTKREKEKKMP